jgi:hypothetical protein
MGIAGRRNGRNSLHLIENPLRKLTKAIPATNRFKISAELLKYTVLIAKIDITAK